MYKDNIKRIRNYRWFTYLPTHKYWNFSHHFAYLSFYFDVIKKFKVKRIISHNSITSVSLMSTEMIKRNCVTSTVKSNWFQTFKYIRIRLKYLNIQITFTHPPTHTHTHTDLHSLPSPYWQE
jgi:hypothetical protein